MNARPQVFSRLFNSLIPALLVIAILLTAAQAQTEVTGAFQGYVIDNRTNNPVQNARVRFINQDNQVPVIGRTDGQGQFFKGNLYPGRYVIEVTAEGYTPTKREMTLPTMRSTLVIPEPIRLEPIPAPVAGAEPPKPVDLPPAISASTNSVGPIVDSVSITAELNTPDARRSGTFTEGEIVSLPLGSITFTRSFDELSLLLPGVAPAPQTRGRAAGPGVGPGVGSSGQFAVNGLRSRANNFTVDGSDNNDEDIGVRRQGFFTLVPQPIESIREYQVTTLLAPAQYGRNLGAQVNAVSKSGGSQTHGDFYGFLNTSQLNAREFFDNQGGLTRLALQAPLGNNTFREVRVDGQQKFVTNPAAAGKDSLTFAIAGFTLGGPLLRPSTNVNDTSGKSAFYFLSFEGQILNSNKEVNFAVPTVTERGFRGSGATGLGSVNSPVRPTSPQGDAIFSLFPFPNNPSGVYGANTFSQLLPASAQGNVASVKLDHNFKLWERQHSATARYNRTQDWRNIPATGDALFATLRPRVTTHNFSFFLNNEITGPNARTPISNQFRASYGRTRLLFEEERDKEFLIPSDIHPRIPFLLNAPLLRNATLPSNDPNQNFVNLRSTSAGTELGQPFRDSQGQLIFGFPSLGSLGPVGQVVIPGFSSVGVDVFNFPQQRVNNTYQIADILTLRATGRGQHSVAFGADFRRSELNSDLPRNSRPQITFSGAPVLEADFNSSTRTLSNFRFNNLFNTPSSLAAASAASNFSQVIAARPSDSNIYLRYYQLNFFGQDEWRIRPNLTLSYGLRYEYNTTPSESSGVIENSFKSDALNLEPVSGLKNFIGSREKIFEADRNNFGPRVGLAYAPNFISNKTTVIRAGYGLFYDQILGAVVSQSRNTFPNFLTLNTGGGIDVATLVFAGNSLFPVYSQLFNPALSLGSLGISTGIRFPDGRFFPYVVAGTLNQFNAANLPLSTVVDVLSGDFPGGFGLTLPTQKLTTPKAHHYSLGIEQQMSANVVFSAAYVGTSGRNLLRLTTPNLGENITALLAPEPFDFVFRIADRSPGFLGIPVAPGQTVGANCRITLVPESFPQLSNCLPGGRPTANAGAIIRYETTAESRYDALQVLLQGRFRQALQYRFGYTFSKVIDDVSDVFDLAGASALPQSSDLTAERGLANFDVRHRFTYDFTYGFPKLGTRGMAQRLLLGGFELAGTGQVQTGQPFTVNSLYDVNLDGNLTDRLNTTSGLIITDDRRQPLRLGQNTRFVDLRAPVGINSNGRVGRNTFRSSGLLLLNLALTKNFAFTERQKMIFRVEAFNFINRANFAIPVRFLEAPGFGQATDTVTPGRRIQFALKYSF